MTDSSIPMPPEERAKGFARPVTAALPSSSSFQVGDVVRCLDDGAFGPLKNGHEYTVRGQNGGVFLAGIEGCFFNYRFELVRRARKL